MKLTKVLGTIIILLSFLFLCFQYLEDEFYGIGVRSLALLALTGLYFVRVKNRNLFFVCFLLSYLIADLFNFASWFINYESYDSNAQFIYIVGNLLYITAYLFLVIRMLVDLDLRQIFKKYLLYVILLFVLGFFCVYFVSETTSDALDDSTAVFENIYNVVVITLMCLALINYIYHDDQKSINLLIGSICIVFSEILQLAYFYIAEYYILNIVYSAFYVLAFVFFYRQSILKHKEAVEYTYEG